MAFVLAPEAAALIWNGVAMAGGALGWHFISKSRENARRADAEKAEEERLSASSTIVTEMTKLIADLRTELVDLKTQIHHHQEPSSRAEEALFDRFVSNLSNMDLTTPLGHSPDIYRIGFLGKVSVGKSTLINAIFGKKVTAMGRGTTTLKPTLIMQSLKLGPASKRQTMVYDLPGDDSDYSYMDVEALRLVNGLDLLVVVFDDTIAYTLRVVKLALALRKHIVFVRNKLDASDDDDDDDDDNELSWQDELERDKRKLVTMLMECGGAAITTSNNNEEEEEGEEEGGSRRVPRFKLFGISARNAFKAVKAALKDYRQTNVAKLQMQQQKEEEGGGGGGGGGGGDENSGEMIFADADTLTTTQSSLKAPAYELYEWNAFFHELVSLSESNL